MFAALRRFRAPDVFNPWIGRDPLDRARSAGALRLVRLQRHFECEPELILVGEAAGYQGCHFSGIPFTSERLLLAGRIPRVACPQRLTRRIRPWSEPSATVLWQTLHRLGIADRVVLWNSFPWHPHRPGNPHSNRRPSRLELRAGAPLLQLVLARFPHARPVAVGQLAREALAAQVGASVPVLRHPAYGGATEFANGLEALARRRKSSRATSR